MSDITEKRARKRVLYRFEAKVEVSGYQVIYPEIHDISMSGVYIKTEETVPVGTRGHITIVLRCGDIQEKIYSQFIVQRVIKQASESQPRGFAVLFEDIDTESSITLFNIIKYQSGEVNA